MGWARRVVDGSRPAQLHPCAISAQSRRVRGAMGKQQPRPALTERKRAAGRQRASGAAGALVPMSWAIRPVRRRCEGGAKAVRRRCEGGVKAVRRRCEGVGAVRCVSVWHDAVTGTGSVPAPGPGPAPASVHHGGTSILVHV